MTDYITTVILPQQIGFAYILLRILFHTPQPKFVTTTMSTTANGSFRTSACRRNRLQGGIPLIWRQEQHHWIIYITWASMFAMPRDETPKLVLLAHLILRTTDSTTTFPQIQIGR